MIFTSVMLFGAACNGPANTNTTATATVAALLRCEMCMTCLLVLVVEHLFLMFLSPLSIATGLDPCVPRLFTEETLDAAQGGGPFPRFLRL